MNRVIGMVSVKNVLVILALAAVLVVSGYFAQAIMIAGLNTDFELPAASSGDAGTAVEPEANAARRAPFVSHNWLPDEIGTGSPAVVVENEGVWTAEDDHMNLGRYLEQERALEGPESSSMLAFLRQKLTASETANAAVGTITHWDSCEPASLTGLQAC